MNHNNQINDLLSKPLWQMSGEEFCQLTHYANATGTDVNDKRERKLARGIQELAQEVGCSESTIYSLRRNGILDSAIVSRIGRRIIFDVDKARVLADQFQEEQREERRIAKADK